MPEQAVLDNEGSPLLLGRCYKLLPMVDRFDNKRCRVQRITIFPTTKAVVQIKVIGECLSGTNSPILIWVEPEELVPLSPLEELAVSTNEEEDNG